MSDEDTKKNEDGVAVKQEQEAASEPLDEEARKLLNEVRDAAFECVVTAGGRC